MNGFRITMTDPVTVFDAPVNKVTAQWGVYNLPRMWQCPDGSLRIHISGLLDTLTADVRETAPDKDFLSRDGGDTWEETLPAPTPDRWESFSGYAPPFTRLPDGTWAGIRFVEHPVADMETLHPVSYGTYLIPNGETRQHAYALRDIQPFFDGMRIVRYDGEGKMLSCEKSVVEMPELLWNISYEAHLEDGSWVTVPQTIETKYFCLNGITVLPDGVWLSLIAGQNPLVTDRQYTGVYLMESRDEGRTWHKRADVFSAPGVTSFGLCEESELLVLRDGRMLCVMRSDLCLTDPAISAGLYLAVSDDGGYTWSAAREIADSSVTPRLMELENGLIVCIYGRPGVHMIVSADRGESWSESHSIIGPTLKECMAAGRDYADCKYWHSPSYSNTQIFHAGENEFVICYTAQEYPETGGIRKMTLVRKIKTEIEWA